VQEELQDIRRAMQLCQVTRFRKAQNMLTALEALGLPQEAVLLQCGRSELLKPLFLVIKDEERKTLLVLVRGTTSIKDVFTSLTGAPPVLIDSCTPTVLHAWAAGTFTARRHACTSRAAKLDASEGCRRRASGMHAAHACCGLRTRCYRACAPPMRSPARCTAARPPFTRLPRCAWDGAWDGAAPGTALRLGRRL
jgi:hypothetical protein